MAMPLLLALSPLATMQKVRILPDVFTCFAFISACEKAQQRRLAFGLPARVR